MARRIISLLLLAWALGFVWFAVALPQPAGEERADGVVVLTGGAGRIDRGLESLRSGWAPRLLVSGVDREVKPHEFAAQYKIGSRQMACCVTLGFAATDTTSNATETAEWISAQRMRSIRLVTSDWHMRRAVLELRRTVPDDVTIIPDAVPTRPSLRMLFLEYHKLLARRITRAIGI
ncbi:MAG: YdcF family protein [Sphingomonadales bacterium]|nr:YdcF family protein [Sphingomonadales bacterium]